MTPLDPAYWHERYATNDTPWDIGYASPPLIHYAEQLPKDTRILIPGAGRAYEAIHLHRAGYTDVYLCDWAEPAFAYLREHAPDFPEAHRLVQDFFQLEPAYDLLLEQTFFCALHPSQRPDYVRKAHELLYPGGRLAGVLFAQPFPFEGPPYGGTAEEYRQLFEPLFSIHQLEIAQASIKPRAGRELFIELERR